MSFYNMMFGMNPNSDSILALLGFKKSDIERFRDCSIDAGNKLISIYARTGGGNREGYPNKALVSHVNHKYNEDDDDFDSTYATYYFDFPEGLSDDILKWCNYQENGIPASIIQKIINTANRPETESDKRAREYKEQGEISKNLVSSGHAVIWNNHTIVPLSDVGMGALLEAIEKYGEFFAYSIRPFSPEIKLNSCRWSHECNQPEIKQDKEMVVINSPFKWVVDEIWWDRWQKKFNTKYPIGLKVLNDEISRYATKTA